MSTPLNQNEGTKIPNTQVLQVENSQLKNEFSTSFHKLETPMGQALFKEVPKPQEWPHLSGEGEYDHMELIRGIEMIKEDFELPDRWLIEGLTPCLPDQPTDEHAVKSRTTEQSSAEDIINILEEVTTRTRAGSSKVNLKTRLNTPWKDSVDKNHKGNSNNVEYNLADIIKKCHIFQSTTHLANTCPKRGEIKEIEIEKEPDVEKDDNMIEENSDYKS
ncbi:hypothetical protein O181_091999 [Austropuccinia psidii MF-1]|uniref:Uncharacterized protein n=1 Tax=Austropuccinia psidii MF-1 TaxID=1389203 RepID=A0A9Q3IYF4_9BASI|nr:hypothetical protein [Austropuccinia psidii MF-1]